MSVVHQNLAAAAATMQLTDEPLFQDLFKRRDEPGRKINRFTQSVEAGHRPGPPASSVPPASRP